ncbi:MAG: hypothetical protein H6550_03725 [Chitinophagales bacterium]|nr:hypothetical protein [Chitinophagales bacterium]
MDGRKINIDEFFDREMGNHAETPPPAIWDALEKRLDAQNGRKKVFPIWWFWGIGALILVSATVIMAGYLYNSGGKLMADNHATPLNDKTSAEDADVAQFVQNNEQQAGNSVNEDNIPSHTANKKNISEPQTTGNTTNSKQRTDNNKHTEQNTAPALSSNDVAVTHSSNHQNNSGRNTAPDTRGRQQDIMSLMPQQAMSSIATPVAAVTRSMQTVPLPAVPLATDNNTDPTQEAGTNNKTGQTKKAKPAIIPPSESIMASVNPADAFSATQPLNIPAASEVMDMPAISPESITEQYSYTDTGKKKKLFIPADSSGNELSETVAPVITKKKKPLPLDFGIKAGYSLGFNQSWRANKWAVAPYLEYRLPSNFSVILQPTFHMGNATTGTFANGIHDYHKITSSTFDSTSRLVRGAVDSSILTPNPPDTIFRTYTYGQVYDSIHVGKKITGKQMWDIELPLMVKYQVNKTFAFILGGSVTYSSVLQTKEEMNRFTNLGKQYTENIDPATFYTTVQGQPAPDGPAPKSFSDLFTYNTDEYTGYDLDKETTYSNFFRYGFMIGASASFGERWMVDVMVHKTGVDKNSVPDKELQKLYTQPYMRITIGYRLSNRP